MHCNVLLIKVINHNYMNCLNNRKFLADTNKQTIQPVKDLLLLILQLPMNYLKLRLTAIKLINKAAPFLSQL